MTIVLTTGATSGAVVEIITYGSVTITDAVRRSGDTFAGAVAINSTLAAGNTTITGNTTTTTLNSGNTAITGTLAAGNTTITGTANVSQGLTANTLTVSTNTATFGTAVYHVANGNVGIGVTTPASMLTVAGGTVDIRSASGDSNGLKLSMDVNGIGYINAGYTVSNIVFQTAGTERFRISNTGVIGLTGGITFPASQNASSDANTLDDYEEGTFTATLTSSTPPSTPPTTTAYYTKIGRMVTVAMRFGNVNTSGGSGAMYITGLPFNPTGVPADCYTAIPSLYGFSFSGAWVAAYTSAGSIYFLSTSNGSTWSDMSISAGASKYVQFSLTYQVA